MFYLDRLCYNGVCFSYFNFRPSESCSDSLFIGLKLLFYSNRQSYK
ncbi:hypothetical protein NEIFLAOT_00221 [Neisseria flavescens NRL30031/H210]|uniref:Uncharacterized protein n=1 Tax=Neisseria flavescens NRL30031/H210 TaxID=546264 RepID=C0EJY2_NEIFL|nr:hypothetical protein NEIFLAOT_00221 [Neisseria flavescens NRL30031/H210]